MSESLISSGPVLLDLDGAVARIRLNRPDASNGLDEAITYSFTAPAAAARVGGVGEGRPPIPLRNPLSEEWSVMRTSVAEVNNLLNRFSQMQQMMKKMGKFQKMMAKMGGPPPGMMRR